MAAGGHPGVRPQLHMPYSECWSIALIVYLDTSP
jgi:hypothetical protein